MLEKQGPCPRSEGRWCLFVCQKEAETSEGQPGPRGREELSCVTSALARQAPSFWFCLKLATSFCRAERPSHTWTPRAYGGKVFGWKLSQKGRPPSGNFSAGGMRTTVSEHLLRPVVAVAEAGDPRDGGAILVRVRARVIPPWATTVGRGLGPTPADEPVWCCHRKPRLRPRRRTSRRPTTACRRDPPGEQAELLNIYPERK